MNLESLLELAEQLLDAQITVDRGWGGKNDYHPWTIRIDGDHIHKTISGSERCTEDEYKSICQAIREELITVLREMLVLLEDKCEPED